MANATLTLICTGSALVFTMGSAELRAKFAQALGSEGAYIEPHQIALILLAGMLWSVAWPVIVLVWFSRAGLAREVESW